MPSAYQVHPKGKEGIKNGTMASAAAFAAVLGIGDTGPSPLMAANQRLREGAALKAVAELNLRYGPAPLSAAGLN